MSAQEIVPYAQIGTAFIATAALGVATWSLATQKAVARRRAAIDFFLKTEMDEKMLAAYNIYVTSKAQIAQFRRQAVLPVGSLRSRSLLSKHFGTYGRWHS
jgi:hypothetical protein